MKDAHKRAERADKDREKNEKKHELELNSAVVVQD
jgi:hypothetical protein